MSARAAVAALAILAGALVTPPAAAANPPAPAPPFDAPPLVAPPTVAPPTVAPPTVAPPTTFAPPGYAPVYAPPGYAPPGYAPPGYAPPFFYAPWPPPSGWDSAQRPAESTPAPPPPPPPARDPMINTGLAVGAAGILTTALGVGLFVSAGSAQTPCGLSGCLDLPDPRRRSNGAAVLAGGVGAALFGGAVAFVGAHGPTPPRQSNARMVAGLVFTALGVGAASGAVMQAAQRPARDPLPGEVFPEGYSRASAHDALTPAALALTSGACLAMGLPLWLTGTKAPRARRDRAAVGALDLLPSAGGVALRWTR